MSYRFLLDTSTGLINNAYLDSSVKTSCKFVAQNGPIAPNATVILNTAGDFTGQLILNTLSFPSSWSSYNSIKETLTINFEQVQLISQTGQLDPPSSIVLDGFLINSGSPNAPLIYNSTTPFNCVLNCVSPTPTDGTAVNYYYGSVSIEDYFLTGGNITLNQILAFNIKTLNSVSGTPCDYQITATQPIGKITRSFEPMLPP